MLTDDGVPVAGWWLRAVAALIDGVIVGILAALLSIPLLQTFVETFRDYFDASLQAARQGLPAPPQPDASTFMTTNEVLGITAVAVIVRLLWHTLFLRLRSATPGKMMLGLRVVPVGQGRSTERLSWPTSLVRALVWVLPNLNQLLLVLRLVDVVLPLTNPRKQALHDLAARTQVVRRR